MTDTISSFDSFAKTYDKVMGDTGDNTHQKTIDPALFQAIGDFKDKVIYDMGCGNGYIARKFARDGAKEVWASDISEELIKIAQEKYENPDNKIKYFACDAANFDEIPEDYFDLVTMNMAIFYIADFKKLVEGVYKILKAEGRFIFTTAHPLRILGKIDAKKEKDESKINLESVLENSRNYLNVREEVVYNSWNGKKDLKLYNAPLSFYINTMSERRLLVDSFVEPKTVTVIDDVNNLTRTESNIPLVYAIGAKKV